MIYLDELKNNDFDIVKKWRKKWFKKQFYKTPIKLNKNTQNDWFNKMQEDNKCKFWIVRSANLKIGIIGIYNIDKEKSRCTLEYCIEDYNFRNRKISPYVLEKVHKFIHENLGIKEVYCILRKRDERSIYVFSKFGYNIEKSFAYNNICNKEVLYLKYTKKE